VLPAGALTGHTADDQAETVLLRLLRGSGGDGLSGIEPGPRHPILALRRIDTEAVCAEVGIEPVRDASNVSPAMLRNRVRHELLPLANDIAGRDVVPLIARTAARRLRSPAGRSGVG
jgi:tRNA(Ile)-lysidine synthase